MKKILLSLLIFSLIEFDIYGETYTIPLTYQVSPTYTVTVPKTVDISSNETSFNFSVSGDIYLDYKLEVLFQNNTTITNGINTVTVNVSQNKDTFTYIDLLNNTSTSVNLSHQELNSGTWTGTLNILITLKEGA